MGRGREEGIQSIDCHKLLLTRNHRWDGSWDFKGDLFFNVKRSYLNTALYPLFCRWFPLLVGVSDSLRLTGVSFPSTQSRRRTGVNGSKPGFDPMTWSEQLTAANGANSLHNRNYLFSKKNLNSQYYKYFRLSLEVSNSLISKCLKLTH